MSLPAQFYAYIFFEISPQLRQENASDSQISCFFDQWIHRHRLEENTPLDLTVSGLSTRRFAAKKDLSLSVCIFQFQDIDIFEIKWQQTPSDDFLLAFWEKAAADLEKDVELKKIPSYLGCRSVLSAHSSDGLILEKIAGLECCVQLPSYGDLYAMDKSFLFTASKNSEKFLERNFPIILSYMVKLAFITGEYEKIKNSLEIVKNEAESLLDLKECYSSLKCTHAALVRDTSKIGCLQKKLRSSLLHLNAYLKTYQIEDDSLFAPFIQKYRNIQTQIAYDLAYACLLLKNIDKKLNILNINISTDRLKSQRRLELFIITLMAAQIIAPSSWLFKLLIMLGAPLAVYLIIPPWFLSLKK